MQNVILYAALGLGAGALIASIALGVVLSTAAPGSSTSPSARSR